MHEDMHDAFKMRENRHARLMLHAGDETLAAARHDHVDIAVEAREHRANGGAIRRRDKRDRRFGKLCGFQPRDKAGVNGGRRAQALGAAAQDRGVAGLQTQAAGVGGDIGPAFIDHADDAKRRRDALDLQAVRAIETRQNAADRVRQIGDLLQSTGDRLDAGGIKRQPIEERRRRSARLGVSDVERIGGEYGVALAANFAGRGAQRLVLGVGGGERHRPRRCARGAPERDE